MIKNETDYARMIGYAGERDVLVRDGKVISHRNVCWFQFCWECRKGKR